MSVFKGSTQRRRDIRRSIPRQGVPLRELLSRSQVILGSLLVLLFLVVASGITVESRRLPDYKVGQLVDKAQVARRQFQSVNLKATEEARKNAAQKTPPIYVPNATFLEATQKAIANLPAAVAAADSVDKIAPEIVNIFGINVDTLAALKQYSANPDAMAAWNRQVENFLSRLRRRAIIDSERYQLERQSAAVNIRLRFADADSLLLPQDFMVNVADAKQVRGLIDELASDFPPPIRQALDSYFIRSAKATYRYDDIATKQARTAAENTVPEQLTIYEPNQVIVPAGAVLDEDGYRLLQREIEAYLNSLRPTERIAAFASPILLIAMIAVSLVCYIAFFKPRIISNPMRGLALSLLMLTGLTLAWLGRSIGVEHGTPTLLPPMLLVSMIVVIAYDQRFAMAIAVLESLLIAVAMELSAGMLFMILLPSMMAIAQLREVRHRGAFGRAGALVGLTAALCVWAVGLAERNMVPGLVPMLTRESIAAFVGSVLTGFVILGLLPFIERAFKVTTAMSLLELCDVNQPLLRRLAQLAPGTYNHSLQVGTLAEAAAESIGGNGLLARVGAYYHDIGKIHKPQYFVENQSGGANLHDKLSPAMSLLIIVGHVKDGIEMAREYGLPPVLHHFIESHHGTTLVEYFYHAAKRQKGEDEQPEEIEYRYPGPRPQTREAAILMICDATESACRCMSEPTAVRIEQLVHKIIMQRLMDDQFAECEITLADLETIEQAITRTLAAIYHGRISYPSTRATPTGRDRSDQDASERASA